MPTRPLVTRFLSPPGAVVARRDSTAGRCLDVIDLSKMLADALANAGMSSVLKERLSLAKDQAEALEKKAKELEREIADLKEQNRSLATALEGKTVKEEFVEHRGALFKRKPKGGYHLAVYCPRCRHSAGTLEDFFHFSCDACSWASSFTGRELEGILKELDH